MRARAIGIDVGTTGVRASALTEDGTTVGTGAISMSALGCDPTSPETWWRGVCVSLAELRKSCDLRGVRGLAVDGTSGTMLAVDTAGAPIGAASMYNEPCDDEAVMRAIAQNAPADSAALGRTSALARVLMMQCRPGVRFMLHQADWIAGKLSGAYGRSDANNALKTGYDPVARLWPEWIARAGADIEKLPVVFDPGALIAPAGPEAIALGIPPSAIVHAGTTDGCASFLATGAAEIGDGVTALGSTLVVKLLCKRPIFAPQFGIYSHRIDATWLAGGASNTGGRVIEHLFGRDRLGLLSSGLRPDQLTGLDYYPLVDSGERFPVNDPQLAPRLEPRPDDEATFFQGVLEGIAEIEALAYRRLRELGAPPLRSVRSVGGGAANAGWTRVRQRVLSIPFERALSQQASDGVARLVLRHAQIPA